MKMIIKEIKDSASNINYFEKYNIDDEIEIEYDDVTVPGEYHPATWGYYGGDPEYYDEDTADITYTVDTSDVIDAMMDEILNLYPEELRDKIVQLEREGKIDESNDLFYQYLGENFNDIIYDKLFDSIFNYYQEDAEEWAWENYDD